MKIRKSLATLTAMAIIIASTTGMSFADASKIVTIGEDLKPEQKQTVLKYFGVNENEVDVITVNNKEERQYLEGIATEAQIGNKTFSCAYIEPTKSGSGINVKTANLNWVTSSMIASTLATAGVTDANVLAAAPFEVSGTGALTGVFKAYEKSTGDTLDDTKKEIATEEIVITGELGDSIGPDKAAGVVNDIKADIIKNNTKDTVQIAETINNITNNYNVTLTADQTKALTDVMSKIAEQDYDYNAMKDTFSNVSKDVETKLEAAGEKLASSGFFDSIKNFFSGIGDWFVGIFDNKEENLGILTSTDDNALGEDAILDATNEAIPQTTIDNTQEEPGFFEKIWNWFTGLFNGGESEPLDKIEGTGKKEENNELIESMDKTTGEDLENGKGSFEDSLEGVEPTIPKEESKDIPVDQPQGGMPSGDDEPTSQDFQESMDKGAGSDLEPPTQE